jgi:hypothetical protein
MGIKGATAKKSETAKKSLWQAFFGDFRTTLASAITGAALGYAGYVTGNPELFVAGAGAFAGGLLSKDSKVEEEE